MKITVGVITFNECAHIEKCLEKLFVMDFPVADYEVVIVDGNSSDGTIEIVEKFQKLYSNIRLIVEPRKGAAIARKVVIEQALYDFVAFTDADCEVPSDWLTILRDGFLRHKKNHENLVAVGGRNEVPTDGKLFLKALTVALDTFLGSMGSTQGTIYKFDRVVSSIPTLNILYDRAKVIETGNFDESLISDAEDADMNFRLTQMGYKLVYLKDSVVFHKYRPDIIEWAKNMFKYGRGRGKILKKHGTAMWSYVYVLPLIFILSFFCIVLADISKIFFLPLLYFQLFYFMVFIYL